MDTSRYIEVFTREAEEHLQVLREGLLLLEKDGFAAPLVHELLRSAHTLKGSAGLLDLNSIVRLSHHLEEVLKEMEGGTRPLSPEQIDLLLVASDVLENLVVGAASGKEEVVDLEPLLVALKTGSPAARPATAPATVRGERETVRASVSRLDQLGNLIGELLIQRRFFEERQRQTHRLLRQQENFLHRLRKAENYRLAKQITEDLRRLSIDLERDLLNLSYLAGELQDGAMELRLLPLSTITGELTRLVRDLARDQGKEVVFTIVGEEVEVDRTMLEAAKPMFLHLLRNAVDHGIGTPQERQAAGKPAAGRIELSARYDRGFVQLILRDDGQGIDPQQVRRVAVERRLLTAAEAASLSDDQAVYQILRPGFSTREFITDISGRGVGMDVVKSNIDRVKGNLTIQSVVGRGTEMHLQLPLSLAVITSLVFECAGQVYAVPLHYVREVLRLTHDKILLEGGREVVRAGGGTLPLLSLPHILQLPEEQTEERLTALVLHFQERRGAFLISRSLGVQDLVVKGLGNQLKSIPFFSGATILGDGSPALILSVVDLFDRDQAPTRLRQQLTAQAEATRRGRVLVVDDSITTRTMEKNILETRGYQVTVAISGFDALEKLAAADFDLMVSDVEMPGMTGFELTRQVRANASTRALPVIIVTSLASDEHRRCGMEVGAQAYIVKGSFDQGALLETVETLIG